MFPLLKLLETSPDCFNFSNIMESGLATSSTICSGSLLLGSFGLPHFQVPQMALNLVFSCCGLYLIPLDPTLRFHELGGQKGDGQNKSEAKKLLSISAFTSVVGKSLISLDRIRYNMFYLPLLT